MNLQIIYAESLFAEGTHPDFFDVRFQLREFRLLEAAKAHFPNFARPYIEIERFGATIRPEEQQMVPGFVFGPNDSIDQIINGEGGLISMIEHPCFGLANHRNIVHYAHDSDKWREVFGKLRDLGYNINGKGVIRVISPEDN